MTCNQTPAAKVNLRTTLLVACLLAALSGARAAPAAPVVTTNGDYVIVINATYGEYGDVFDDLYGYGPVGEYRVVWFNADWFEQAESAGGGPPTQSPHVACNAIFVKNTAGLVFGHEFGITADAMDDVVELCHGAGLQMMQIEAYDTDNGIRYAYLWYDQPGPDWEANIEVIPSVHNILADNLEDDGFSAVNICLTETPGGSERITSLFKTDFSDTYVPDYPILDNDLYFLRMALAVDGYRMTSLEVVNHLPYDTRFLPVFKRTGALAFTYEGTAYAEVPSVTADINDDEMQGMQPVLIANVYSTAPLGLGWSAQPLAYALWRGQAKVHHQAADDFLYRNPQPPESAADDLAPDLLDRFGLSTGNGTSAAELLYPGVYVQEVGKPAPRVPYGHFNFNVSLGR